MGDYSDSLSIRGFSGNRILLNLNGRPVNRAGVGGGYYIDWNTVTLDNVEKVEIIRGGSSARYSNTLGGIINVTTRTPTRKPEVALFANFGTDASHHLGTARLTHSYKIGPVGYAVAGSFQKANAFLWNNDFEGKNVSLATTVDLPFRGVLSGGFQFSHTRVGLIRNNRAVDQDTGDPEDPDDPGYRTPIHPGYPPVTGIYLFPTVGHAFIPGTGSYTQKTLMLYDLGWEQPIGKGLLQARGYWNDERMRDRNFASCDIVWFSGDTCRPGVEGTLVLDQTVETDRSRGGRIDFAYPLDFPFLLGAHQLRAGFERHEVRFGNKVYDHFDPDWNSTSGFFPFDYPGYGPSSEGIHHGFYLEDDWQPWESLLLTLGLRYDHFRNRVLPGGMNEAFTEWALSPKATGTLFLRGGHSVTASLYQAFRAPGQPEIYWWSNPQLFPGGAGLLLPEGVLKAEKSKAVELTYELRLGMGQLRLAGWYYWVDDYLMLRFDPRAYVAYNIDKATLYGLSLDMRLEATTWLNLHANFAFQQTGKDGDFLDPDRLMDGIDYVPKFKAFAGADIRLPRQARLSLNLSYIGEREALYLYGGFGRPEKQTVVKLDDVVLVDLSLKIPVVKPVVLGLYVENLLGATYEERYGFPLPGRIFGVDVRASF